MVYPPEFVEKKGGQGNSGTRLVGAVRDWVETGRLTDEVGEDIVMYGSVGGTGVNGQPATRYYKVTCTQTKFDRNGTYDLRPTGDTQRGLRIEGFEVDEKTLLELDTVDLPRTAGSWRQKTTKRVAGIGAGETARLINDFQGMRRIEAEEYQGIVDGY